MKERPEMFSAASLLHALEPHHCLTLLAVVFVREGLMWVFSTGDKTQNLALFVIVTAEAAAEFAKALGEHWIPMMPVKALLMSTLLV